MSRRRTSLEQERINPEFRGISQRYSKKKKERKELESAKHSLQKSLNYTQKLKQSVEINLNRKRDELMYLKSVRERHLNDIKHKLQMEQKNSKVLEQLKMRTSHARITTKQNIKDAILSKKKEKLRAKMKVMEELEDIKKVKEKHQSDMRQLFQLRAREQEEEKSMRKSKINKFYRNKNKFVLNNYRSMLNNEELQNSRSREQIQYLHNRTNRVYKTLSKKKSKLKSIEDEIEYLREEAREAKNLSYYRWASIDQSSQVSKKSSHPSQILKESYSSALIKKKTENDD